MISLREKQALHGDEDEDEDEDDDEDGKDVGNDRAHQKQSTSFTSEAHRLVRLIGRKDMDGLSRVRSPSPALQSGQVTPTGEDPTLYVERPAHYRGGILSSLLKLYEQQPLPDRGRRITSRGGSRRGSLSGDVSARGLSPDPGWKPPRPRKWYDKSPSQSTTSLAGAATSSPSKSRPMSPVGMLKHSRSLSSLGGGRRKPQLEDEIRITVHIAEILSRQKYLIRLCRALIRFGAPTHRLEEYLTMSARVLEIDMQCLYIPGCMIVSFGDASTHTTDMNLVRSPHGGTDLGKLADTHEVYKEVVHDVIGVEEATQRLEEVMRRKKRYPVWLLVLMHGCACAVVGPFAFGARPIDMPIAFVLGCIVGLLQLVFSPRSSIYSNIFEISAAVLTAFLARAFGSIEHHGERLFCFSSLAQSSIALILPGYVMLCASLELQSRNMVAGSVRLVYAIIYSLFLGFGITVGTVLYGLMDTNATTDYTCRNMNYPNEYIQHFPFVLVFTFFLCMINQAKWKQMPVMITIGIVGYLVNYFSGKRFPTQSQISLPSMLGAFVVGVLGNLYSRLRHGVAAAAILPAIFVLVPSGLAASGSLVSGIASAGDLVKKPNPYSIVTNGTEGFMNNVNMTGTQHSTVVLDIGYGMVQIAIAFTVGLFLSAMVVYPFGKKRSGLFSF